jgi:hypothetical protein
MDHPQSTPDQSPRKTCRGCGTAYPATPTFFHRDRRNPDGLHNRCRVCRNSRQRSTYQADYAAQRGLSYRQRTRLAVLQHYGGDPPVCACCGEHRLAFLAIDHSEGNGKQHRRSIGRNPGSYAVQRWIQLHGFPRGFRVLCHICNLAIGFYGSCPHEAERAASVDVS